MKKKVVIFANCQSGAIGKTLLESNAFKDMFEWVVIPPVHSINTSDGIKHLLDSVSIADVFIYQVVNNLGWPEELKSNFLLDKLKVECLKISIPSMYFDGYFPHLSTMDGKEGPLNLVHDYFIASGFIKGMSVLDVKNMITSEYLYDEVTANNSVENALNSLREREVTQMLDIRISSYIEDNFKTNKLFNQFNHPSRDVIEYVCDSILDTLGVSEKTYKSSNGEYLGGIIVPLYISTFKNLKMTFLDDEKYRGVGGVKLSLEQVIQGFFELYQTLNFEFIKMQINNKKPFTLKLVEKYIEQNS